MKKLFSSDFFMLLIYLMFLFMIIDSAFSKNYYCKPKYSDPVIITNVENINKPYKFTLLNGNIQIFHIKDKWMTLSNSKYKITKELKCEVLHD